MFVVVRLSGLAKNVPGRNRCGYRFTHQPQVAEVTPEELEIIKNDQYLKVCNFPSVAWFEAMNIERTQVNEDAHRGEDGEVVWPKKLDKRARLAPRMDVEEVVKGMATHDHAAKPTVQEGDSKVGGNPPTTSTQPAVTGGLVGGTNKVSAPPHELSASSNKEELIAALVKKGKKEGKDFNKDAAPEKLFALLKTL